MLYVIAGLNFTPSYWRGNWDARELIHVKSVNWISLGSAYLVLNFTNLSNSWSPVPNTPNTADHLEHTGI